MVVPGGWGARERERSRTPLQEVRHHTKPEDGLPEGQARLREIFASFLKPRTPRNFFGRRRRRRASIVPSKSTRTASCLSPRDTAPIGPTLDCIIETPHNQIKPPWGCQARPFGCREREQMLPSGCCPPCLRLEATTERRREGRRPTGSSSCFFFLSGFALLDDDVSEPAHTHSPLRVHRSLI
jgi:hypothetical protein